MKKYLLGFTLIELLVVMAILGILAAGVFVAINPLKQINQANDARIKSDIGQLAQSLQSYYTLNTGAYPANLDALVASGDIKTIPNPPVTGSYTYTLNSNNQAVVYFPVQYSQSGKQSLWCWSSETNQVTQVEGVSCDPATGGGIAPTQTPTPIPPTNTPMPTATATPTPPFTNGLVGYWKMNETSWNGTSNEVVDSSGNGNHGKAACFGTGCSIPTTASGKFGNGGKFDGTDDNVTINNSNYLNMNTNAFTLATWVKLNMATTRRKFIYKGNSNQTSIKYALGKYEYGTNFQFIAYTNSSNNHIIAGTINTDTWYHVVAIFDGSLTSSQMKLYVNGNQVGTANLAGSLISDANPVYLGSKRDSDWINGVQDEVRIYNRALSASEVQALYNFTPTP